MDARDPEQESAPAEAPPVVRVGHALAMAVVCALVAVMPAALRLAAHSDPSMGLPRAWILLAGLAVLPLAFASALLRGAATGFRGLGPDAAGGRLVGSLAWGAWMLAFLFVLGASLRAKTHHHALAGVTFALAALAAGLFFALLARRFRSVLRSLEARGATSRVVTVFVIGIPLLFLAFALRDAGAALDASSRATIIDGSALGLAALFGARLELPARRELGAVGLPLALVLAGLAVFMLRDAATREAFDGNAPALAWLLSLFGQH